MRSVNRLGEERDWFGDAWFAEQSRRLHEEPWQLWQWVGERGGQIASEFVARAVRRGRTPCSLSFDVSPSDSGKEGARTVVTLLQKVWPALPRETAITRLWSSTAELYLLGPATVDELKELVDTLAPAVRPLLGEHGEVVGIFHDDQRAEDVGLYGTAWGTELVVAARHVAPWPSPAVYLNSAGVRELKVPLVKASDRPWTVALIAPDLSELRRLCAARGESFDEALHAVWWDVRAAVAKSFWSPGDRPLFEMEPGMFPLGLLLDRRPDEVEPRVVDLCEALQRRSYGIGGREIVAEGQLTFRHFCTEATATALERLASSSD